MKCWQCGYEFSTPEEVRNNEAFECPRTLVNQKDDYTRTVETCYYDRSTGKFYPPGTNPYEIHENPDAHKEGIINMLETNETLKAKALEKFNKALDERDQKLRELQKQKPKT